MGRFKALFWRGLIMRNVWSANLAARFHLLRRLLEGMNIDRDGCRDDS